MKLNNLILPGIALGAAALLLGPAEESHGFTTIGGSLSTSQRDVRVFNNFADAATNNNTTIHPNWPGWDGAELSNWKAAAEWGSTLHGDGSGDSTQSGGVGSGGANFDAFWSGAASGVGSSNDNIISAISSCGGGTLAFTETPISDGWRIRVCDNWVWQDGPGSSSCGGSSFDLQGVNTHEYGHALGLGHTGVGGATMFSGTSCGNSERSIATDDINGVRFIYGVASGGKPVITNAVSTPGSGSVTITGSNFSSSGNQVWFTNANTTSTGSDPRVIVSGVSSTSGGTSITVSIPANAGPGDVSVKAAFSGHSSLSNAFPLDPDGTPGGGPLDITSIVPSSIPALIPGTDQTIQINGTGFLPTAVVEVDGVPVSGIPSNYTFVNGGLITLNMPEVATLGAHTIGVRQGTDLDVELVSVVAPSTPQLQVGTGDIGAAVFSFAGLDTVFGGQPGCPHLALFSLSNVPSVLPSIATLDIGNNFSQLQIVGTFVIDPRGWTSMTFPLSGSFSNTHLYFQSVDLCTLPVPVVESNFQHVVVIL